MFSRLNQIIFSGLAVLILGLGGWCWFQGQMIASLQAENQTQAQTITQLELEQLTLQTALEAERIAVTKQQQFATQLKAKMEQSRENVRIVLQKEPCAVTAMPRDVIDGIKRLHPPSAN